MTTDRRAALVALKDAVEAGEWVAAGDDSDTWLLIFDAGLRAHHGRIYSAWCLGSTDAALALLGAVLPGWGWRMQDCGTPYGLVVHGEKVFESHAPTPSRALLLATFKAMLGQEARDG